MLAAAFRRRAAGVVDLEPIAETRPARGRIAVPSKVPAQYYRQRLQHERPDLARAIDCGQLSVFQASVIAGFRKAPRTQQLRGWFVVTRWISPSIVHPFAVQLNAVVLDSVFNFPWGIAKRPSPIDEWQGAVLLFFFLVRPVERFGRSFVDYIRPR
jgi:hypothetical protein